MQASKATPKPVIFVEIGGKKRPLRYGHNALGDFCDARDIGLTEVDARLSSPRINDMRALLWAGLKDGARKEKQPFEAAVEDVGDWIDEADGQDYYEIALRHLLNSTPAARAALEAAEAAGEEGKAKKKPAKKAA